MNLPSDHDNSWQARYYRWTRRRLRMDDESTLGHGGLSLKYLKPAFHHLRTNGIVYIAGDSPNWNEPDSGPFLTIRGRPFSVVTGGIDLAQLAGADVIPCFAFVGDRPPFCLQIQEPLRAGESGDRELRKQAMLADYRQRFEYQVERHPENILHPRYLRILLQAEEHRELSGMAETAERRATVCPSEMV